MAKKVNNTLCFFTLFQKFINDSKSGKRLQPNGNKIKASTIINYANTLKLLKAFTNVKNFQLRIKPTKKLQQRDWQHEKNYWKKFYNKFTNYLYNDCGYYDNYVGQNIKNIKTFFSYINKDHISIGDFHKLFYVRKESIAIFPLLPEELNYLIYDEEFENSLSPRMRQVKDVFVFGCTVALRVSDLLLLKKSSIRLVNGAYYLAVRSIKTSTETLVRLPDYAVAVINKYPKKAIRLLPKFNKVNLNRYIKLLLEKAGFTQKILLQRSRRGVYITVKHVTANNNRTSWRFCDVSSTHTMRRTAITTMLCLGVPEDIVRKVSGHAPGSKEFYRYVHWAQAYQDKELGKMYEKLKTKKINIIS